MSKSPWLIIGAAVLAGAAVGGLAHHFGIPTWIGGSFHYSLGSQLVNT